MQFHVTRYHPAAATAAFLLSFRPLRFALSLLSTIITLDLRSVRLGFAEAALLEGGGETKRRIG